MTTTLEVENTFTAYRTFLCRFVLLKHTAIFIKICCGVAG